MTQPGQGRLDFLLALARATAHPVVLAQLVDHRATNALGGEGLELHTLGGLVPRERLGQADQANLDQIVHLDGRRQLGHHVVRQATHQGHVLPDQGITVQLALRSVRHGRHSLDHVQRP
jgi:hypothetical protein